MTLSFQDCQELKEHGFPQQPAIDISGIDGVFLGGFYTLSNEEVGEGAIAFLNQREYEQYKDSTKTIVIKYPTLSELIDACSEKFLGIQHRRILRRSGLAPWYAKEIGGNIVDGTTPEEAVKKLWLSLNKKP